MQPDEEIKMLLIGAERFLRESQNGQEKLHDNADSLIFLRTATKNLVKAMRLLAEPTTATPSAGTPAPECAHEWMDWFAMVDGSYSVLKPAKSETVWCRWCGALRLYGKMFAPGAAT